MVDKIKITRLNEKIPELSNNTGKLILRNNNQTIYVNKDDLANSIGLDNTVNSFKINSMTGTSINVSGGSVLSQNNKIIRFNGGTFDTSKGVNDNEIGDKIVERLWNQPIITNYTTPYGEVTASSFYDNNYYPWKAFNGTNSSNTDCWHSKNNSTEYPHWLQYKTIFPIRVEKFVIQNRQADATTSGTVFDILASQDGVNWDILVSVNNKDIIPNTVENAINEYQAKETLKEYSYFRYVNYASTHAEGYVSIGRFIIVAYYHDFRIPNQSYNIFAIGGENKEGKILTSIDNIPTLPDGYTEYAKIGFYNTNILNETEYFYPSLTLEESFMHGNVIAESLETIGYRIYSDGWKVQWGNNANPTFPVAFIRIPQIVERDATNVTTTGMTITARNWKVEGY